MNSGSVAPPEAKGSAKSDAKVVDVAPPKAKGSRKRSKKAAAKAKKETNAVVKKN